MRGRSSCRYSGESILTNCFGSRIGTCTALILALWGYAGGRLDISLSLISSGKLVQFQYPATMKKLMEIIGNPYYLRRFHGYSTIFWIPFTLLAFLLGWLQSVVFVSFVSMIALFLGSFSSWQASRTEVAQEELNETREDKRFKLRKSRPSKLIPRSMRYKRKVRSRYGR